MESENKQFLTYKCTKGEKKKRTKERERETAIIKYIVAKRDGLEVSLKYSNIIMRACVLFLHRPIYY